MTMTDKNERVKLFRVAEENAVFPFQDRNAELIFALPKVIYAVAGREVNLYFDNLFFAVNPANYAVMVECPVGRQDEKRWRFVPQESDVGTHVMKVGVYGVGFKLVAQAETRIVVASSAVQAGRELSILMVGDSLTDHGVYPDELRKLFDAGAGLRLRMIGSHAGMGRSVVPRGTALEGFGGWAWKTFLTHWTDEGKYNSRSNFLRFENGRTELDVKGYFERFNGGSTPDVITFFLGVNDIALAKRENLEDVISESLMNMEILLDAFRKAAPDALIGVTLIPPPASSQDAFGCNYGCLINRLQYRFNQHTLMTRVLEKYASDKSVSLIPVFTGLDTEHGYPMAEEDVCRAIPELKATRMTNAVHPDAKGYRQIAEVFYAWLVCHVEK